MLAPGNLTSSFGFWPLPNAHDTYRHTHMHINKQTNTWGATMLDSKYKPEPLATQYPLTPQSMTCPRRWERFGSSPLVRAQLKWGICFSRMTPMPDAHWKFYLDSLDLSKISKWYHKNFRHIPKSSLSGMVAGFGPLIFWYCFQNK